MAASARAEAPTVSMMDSIHRHSIPEPNSGCWLWMGSTATGGYGRVWHKGKPELAHRVSYWLACGPTSDKQVLHRCDNPACVNPDHLFLGDIAGNMGDRDKKGRQARGERQGSAVLTETQVRLLRDAKGSERALAKQFGIAPSTVRKIRLRKTWAHLL